MTTVRKLDEFSGIWNHPQWAEPTKLKLASALTAAMDCEFDRVPKVYLDFETFYDPDNGYGLRSMTYEQYIRDPRFQVIMCSFYIPETGDKYWVPNYKDAVRKELEALHLDACHTIAHNNPFDGFILADHYGIEPLEFGCTMTMARPVHGIKAANDLASLAKKYFLPLKMDEVHNVKGMRLEDFTDAGIDRYGTYCMRDTDILAPLYGILRRHYQETDMITMSDTIRAGAVCQIKLDVPLLEAYLPKLEALQAEKVEKISTMLMEEKAEALDMRSRIEAGLIVDDDTEAWAYDSSELPDIESPEKMKKALGSSIQFGQILNALGYAVPMKDSKTAKNKDGTPKRTPALAKNDMGFKELLRSEDEVLVALCEARLGEKSTLGRTRAQSLINIGTRGRMPFPLKAFGAGTGRWAAYQDINCQNFPKRGGDKTLRRAMTAPPGFEIVTCDLSQIEARRMADHANQADLLAQFAHNEDPYSAFATKLYGYEVSKTNGKKTERNVGKECILSLQYTSWFESFWLRLRTAYDLDVTKDFCKDAVMLYRDHYKNIVNFWDECQCALDIMVSGGHYEFGYERNYIAEKGKLILPDGWEIKYEGLDYARKDDGTFEVDDKGRPVLMYIDREKRQRRKIYRGIVANNATQGSSARILMTQMRRLREDGIIWAGTVHDELIFLVPKGELEEWCAHIEAGMRYRPHWAHRTPIDCELTVGANYADQFDLDVWLAGGRTTLGAQAEENRRKQLAKAA